MRKDARHRDGNAADQEAYEEQRAHGDFPLPTLVPEIGE
jgi:hypothetical protein